MQFMMSQLAIHKTTVFKKWTYSREMFLMKFIFIFDVTLTRSFLEIRKVWKPGAVNVGKKRKKD